MKTHRYLLALCCSLTVLSCAASGADPLEGGRFNTNFELPQGIAYSPDGVSLAVFGQTRQSGANLRHGIDLLDSRTGKLRATFPVDDRIHTLTFSPDGKFMVAGVSYDVLEGQIGVRTNYLTLRGVELDVSDGAAETN